MAKRSRNRETKHGRRTAGGAFRRALGLLAFLPVASRLPGYARLVWSLALDERMPSGRKALLGAAAGYLVFGRDVVPDDMPLVGGLDDLVVVALAVDLFLDGVPRDLLEEKLEELGIDRLAYDRDIAQIRRLTPGPVRRVVRRIPGAVAAVSDTVETVGVGPRLRQWINKEESLA